MSIVRMQNFNLNYAFHQYYLSPAGCILCEFWPENKALSILITRLKMNELSFSTCYTRICQTSFMHRSVFVPTLYVFTVIKINV